MEKEVQERSIEIPPEKIGLLKKEWFKIYTPLIELFKLQIRMNLRTKQLDLRTVKLTADPAMLDKATLFIKAILIGYSPQDALIALENDSYLFSFFITEVKFLRGDHLNRAIGRIIGKNGNVKNTIEHVSKTKIRVIEDKVHILGGRSNVDVAKDAVCRLIMGAEPSKVQNKLRALSSKLKERYGHIETVYKEF
ncbi:RNA-binding protein [Tubulinosema ratisbonensis]|uniref:Pre-rRNA-processing protein PNO1 n=1 Tax=Tubulinosema ratisbonensis TaxID=291195 RepID=A0A437AK87_9MICR|nr:RNA-binding protein [Tubulinosema ratisbonensis]